MRQPSVTIFRGIPPSPSSMRPAFFSASVEEKTLLVSVEHAREVLGVGDEFEWASAVFMSGDGARGIWAVPHPDCE